ALFLFTFVLPLGYAVYQSMLKPVRSGSLGLGPATVGFAGLDNYSLVLQQSAFLESFARVLLFGIVQIPVMLLLATALAMALDTLSQRWAGILRAAYFLPYGVPGVIASILWGFLYVPGVSPIVDLLDRAGLAPDFLGYDTVLWSIANIVIWEFAGYNMLVIVAQLKAIPQDLYEAARIDGASDLKIALRIKIPIVMPSLVLTFFFSVIATLQVFTEPMALKPLTNGLSTTWSPLMAIYDSAFLKSDIYGASATAVVLALATYLISFTLLRVSDRYTREDRA
ncbi:carbohydrate ABC transporter permease, partial [Streptomyces rochei]|uniref:carbohydrate ABC transporter permease n=1 Tax=Streptomyces rochei TaxID=1928 RepID=UPI0036F76F34